VSVVVLVSVAADHPTRTGCLWSSVSKTKKTDMVRFILRGHWSVRTPSPYFSALH
jgi:hypothetical protein